MKPRHDRRWAALAIFPLLVVAIPACTVGAAPAAGDRSASGANDPPAEPGPASGTTAGGTAGSTSPPAPSSGPGPTDPTGPTSAFGCTPAGIAAYADALVTGARKSCTADGVGAVEENDYACIKTPIDALAPPHPDASYDVVTTLLATNTDYPMYECTYFVQTVTAGVCGTPISPSNVAWTDYPLAYMFAKQAIPGYTWFANDGHAAVQPGDIFVYGTSGGQDPGHIMIVAAVIDAGHFRIAEANELESNGSAATRETGVVSNTRVATLKDPYFAGWFRLDPH